MAHNVPSPTNTRLANSQNEDVQDEIGLDDIEKGDQRSLLRWMADRINLLGQAIGLDLELLGPVEVESLYWFYLEVCAKDGGRGAIAVTTAETDSSGHWTLGSLMTTVSQLNDVRFLAWAAPAFHPAHVAALEWLDQVTDIRVFGVKVSPEFQLIAG